jgi:hypothetical protein
MNIRKLLVVGSLFMAMLLLFSCSGKQTLEGDKTPPQKPDLIEHLGDAGDNDVMFEGELITLTDENNGIDAVPESDWFRISWKPLLDSDIDFLRIFRYNESDVPEPMEVDSLSYNSVLTHYIDSNWQNYSSSVLNKTWYYFIEAIDTSGNSSVSDTVSYTLLPKVSQIYPPQNAIIDNSDNLYFKWQVNQSLHYRILLFDELHNLLWNNDLYVTETYDDSLKYLGPSLSNAGYFWRIDSFDGSNAGSESKEQYFYIQ